MTDHRYEVRMMAGVRPRRIFAELADGWSYAGWVVGATHIRDVDAEWPAVGTRIHHRVGTWPATSADTTEVLEVEKDRRLVLQARAWPLGRATIDIELVAMGHSTQVVITEIPASGLAKVLDGPLLRPLLRRRNRETLRRLLDRAENRQRPTQESASDAPSPVALTLQQRPQDPA
jgi:hypothetical protein